MMLLWLILIPFLGGVLAWAFRGRHANAPRWVSIAALALDLPVLALACRASSGAWLDRLNLPWIPQLGINFELGLDGLSLLLVLLTLLLGIVSVIISWTEITERTGFFHFNLMMSLTGTIARVPGAGSVPVLLRLGSDAGADVFPHRPVGA